MKKNILTTIRITSEMQESLNQLKKYNVNVSKFIRLAISEKINRDWKSIKEKKERIYYPF